MPVMITGFYASLLALCYLYLSGLVIAERKKASVSLGDGGVEDIKRTMRAHSNFSEYVPICLVLLLCLELNSHFVYIMHGSASALLFGRVLHAYGLRNHAGASWQRVWGMLLTFGALLTLSVANLFLIYWGQTA